MAMILINTYSFTPKPKIPPLDLLTLPIARWREHGRAPFNTMNSPISLGFIKNLKKVNYIIIFDENDKIKKVVKRHTNLTEGKDSIYLEEADVLG